MRYEYILINKNKENRSAKEAGLLDWITFVTNHKATQIKCDLRCLVFF